MFSRISTIAILFVLLLTSCASGSPGPAADWKNGAKRAWIVESYLPNGPNAEMPACLGALSQTELATKHLVKAKYWHVRQMFYTIAEVPDSLQTKVDDQVELWPEECSHGKISRISRVLSSAPE